jgi:hypothetical protein
MQPNHEQVDQRGEGVYGSLSLSLDLAVVAEDFSGIRCCRTLN